MTTKAEIFDLFYGKQNVVRKGGGKIKTKMTRQTPSSEAMFEMEAKLRGNQKMTQYFVKLRDRKPGIAPPPRPRCPKEDQS